MGASLYSLCECNIFDSHSSAHKQPKIASVFIVFVPDIVLSYRLWCRVDWFWGQGTVAHESRWLCCFPGTLTASWQASLRTTCPPQIQLQAEVGRGWTWSTGTPPQGLSTGDMPFCASQSPPSTTAKTWTHLATPSPFTPTSTLGVLQADLRWLQPVAA